MPAGEFQQRLKDGIAACPALTGVFTQTNKRALLDEKPGDGPSDTEMLKWAQQNGRFNDKDARSPSASRSRLFGFTRCPKPLPQPCPPT